MKIIFAFIVSLSLYACSSDYVPSEKMLTLKQDMTEQQAQKYLQQRIWDSKDLKGICGSRGFWYDQNSDMTVYKDGISLLAHRRGKVLEKHPQQMGEVVVFEREYYQYDFLFEQVTSIDVYDDHLRLPTFPECNKKTADKYFIVDLYGDELNNLKFVVFEEDFDKTMAAVSIVLSSKPIVLK
ncbi:MAG: hypothetical protein OQL06_13475 [Gammaproteobacteria bacterium]|nr:hypothetical protein [Gammaproteobacteria bacterium]